MCFLTTTFRNAPAHPPPPPPPVLFDQSLSQSAADSTRRQLQDLSSKIGVSLQPIFTSKKIGDIIKTREPLTTNALFITLNMVHAK